MSLCLASDLDCSQSFPLLPGGAAISYHWVWAGSFMHKNLGSLATTTKTVPALQRYILCHFTFLKRTYISTTCFH